MSSPQQLIELLGPSCVLLSIPRGQKGPERKDWQKLCTEDMTPAYIDSLNHGNNIGVLLGEPSGICTIDCDTDEFRDDLLEANPWLAETLRSRGNRGCNFWIRPTTPFPASGAFFHSFTKNPKNQAKPLKLGEWRANGNQTVISGIHPQTGRPYTRNNHPPKQVAFEDIVWPGYVRVPWPHKFALAFTGISKIMASAFSNSDFVTDNGYLEKGSACALCGQGGIGKSRLIMQWAIASAIGQPFLGWEMTREPLRWLILQTENSTRRLQSDLLAMTRGMTAAELEKLDASMLFHVLETEDDGIMFLSNPEVYAAISERILVFDPHIVVYDPLRDFSTADLNQDEGMTETLGYIARLTKTGNPKRIPLVVHHSRTGKTGAAAATGFERGGFGRNSKVLLGWTRAQINVAPFDAENNESLIVASGKCNNAREFEPFAITLNASTMTYERDDSLSIDDWKERVGADLGKDKSADRKESSSILDALQGSMTTAEWRNRSMDRLGVSRATFYRHLAQLQREGRIFESTIDEKWCRK